jgi:hypothetical protein
MKSPVDYEEMLRDILIDEDLLALRKDLHARCRRELAFRRRRSALRLLLPLAAAVLLLAGLFFTMGDFPKPDGRNPAEQAGAGDTPPWLVRTGPLTEKNTVRTSTANLGSYLVSTPPEQRDGLFVTAAAALCVVTTEDAPPIDEITDREMLALFPGVPRALIDRGDRKKTLFFFNAGDRKRFLASLDPPLTGAVLH